MKLIAYAEDENHEILKYTYGTKSMQRPNTKTRTMQATLISCTFLSDKKHFLPFFPLHPDLSRKPKNIEINIQWQLQRSKKEILMHPHFDLTHCFASKF